MPCSRGAPCSTTPCSPPASPARTRSRRRRALELLDRFGLGEVAPRWPAELSGGMRQRVAVLRTFLDPAPVLLLDEPFGALDALTRQELQGWLASVWADAVDGAAPRTVLLVTHDVEEALLLADRVVVLSSAPGRVVADRPVAHGRPRSPDLVGDPAFVADRARLLEALGARSGPTVSGGSGRAPH
ncbi:MAG: ATP-binding cassette domain-containing protein [Acidimicrobiales bacterium]